MQTVSVFIIWSAYITGGQLQVSVNFQTSAEQK